MTVISNALAFVGLAVVVIGLVLAFNTSISRKNSAGIYAIGAFFMLLSAILKEDHILAGIDATLFAWNLHTWWNNGGGSSFRKKLREFFTRFQGTRRTAPQTN